MKSILTGVALAATLVLVSACSDDASNQRAVVPPSSSSSAPTASPSASAPQADGDVHYVALGDSFVAGPGIGDTSGTCQRSTRNFPSLVAKRLKAASFTDASCSGATTTNYTQAQAENPPQLDSLSEDTTLVTLGTMGGNDIGLVQVASQCVISACGGEGGANLEQAVDWLQPTIEKSVEQVRERAPKARILLIGYGTYLPQKSCAALPSVTGAQIRYLQGIIDRLSDTIKAAAAKTNVEFVDMREIPGVGQHTACAPVAQQWIRGLDPAGDGAMFHPSSKGMKAMAGQVMSTLG